MSDKPVPMMPLSEAELKLMFYEFAGPRETLSGKPGAQKIWDCQWRAVRSIVDMLGLLKENDK